MDIITCVGKVQETEFVRSRSEPGRNCKNNKKFAKGREKMEELQITGLTEKDYESVNKAYL